MTQANEIQFYGEETPLGLSPTNAWMNFALNGRPLVDGDITIPQTMHVYIPGEGYVDLIIVSDDPGNSSNKLTTVKVRESQWGATTKLLPFLSQTRIATSYQVPKNVRFGQGVVQYQVAAGNERDSVAATPSFSIGKYAQSKEADPIPNGSTFQRMQNDRYLPFTVASVVEALVDAGHKAEMIDQETGKLLYDVGGTPIPAVKNIALSFGVRDDEIVMVNGRPVPKPQLEDLIQQLKKKWIVERLDEDGTSHTWHLHFRFVQSYAQSLGGIWAYLHTLSGDAAVNKKVLLALDGGHKDTQILYVDLQNGTQITGGRVGDGGERFTETLRTALMDHGIQLTSVQAQEAFLKNSVVIAGDGVAVDQYLDDATRQATLESILSSTITSIDKYMEAHLLWFGGLAASSPHDLLALMARKGRTTKQFFVCPTDVAPFMNAIGLYALLYYQVLKLKEKRDRMPEAIAAARSLEERKGRHTLGRPSVL